MTIFWKNKKNVFGTIRGHEVQIKLREDVNTLDTKIEWASPIVIYIKTNGKIRICSDFRVTINPYVQVDDYSLPRFEEIIAKLAAGTHFTRIDLKNVYLRMPVHPNLRKYLVISTLMGYFQYRCLHFGVSFAQVLFQKTMDQLLKDIPGVVCYLDDILITVDTLQSHLQRFETVLSRLQEAGIKTQRSTLGESVKFLGQIIDENGLHSLTRTLKQ